MTAGGDIDPLSLLLLSLLFCSLVTARLLTMGTLYIIIIHCTVGSSQGEDAEAEAGQPMSAGPLHALIHYHCSCYLCCFVSWSQQGYRPWVHLCCCTAGTS